MDTINLLLILLYSLVVTLLAIEYFKKKLIKYGYVVIDKYKPGKPKIPTMGGLAMFTGVIVALALSQVLLRASTAGQLFTFYFIVTIYALYGFVDDMFSFKMRYDKIIALFILSLPIASLMTNDSVTFWGHTIYLGLLLPLIIAPTYIMVVANLINVHSGFNGLSLGLTGILLLISGIKSYMLFGTQNLIFLFPILGAVLAILPFSSFPAKIFEGNGGQFMAGAALGAFLILNNLGKFGIIILFPHIINFLMDTITLKIMKIPLTKFGKVRKDGTIAAPPSMKFVSLKFLITHYFRLKENQATHILYAITIVFGVIGLIIT